MDTDDLLPGCYSCDQLARGALPPREDVVHTQHWHVAHAFNSTLPGWLVVLPTRHVTVFTELSLEAADELGGLVRRLSSALESVTGCVKTYVMQFSEAEGYEHLHFHVVPRAADLRAEVRGPKVFAFLSDEETLWLPVAERDQMALAVRAALLEA